MILDRRRFLGGLPALLPAAAAPAAEQTAPTRFYLMEQFHLQQGTQPARIHDFFSKSFLPAIEKIHKGPKIFLDAVFADHLPQVAVIFGLSSVDEVWSLSRTMFANPDFARAYREWEAGEPPYLSTTNTLLEATSFSPEIVIPEKPGAARYFEMRTYHPQTSRQLRYLLERFSGAEINIFHRSGVNPLFYSTTVFGDLRPNLTYLIPFDSLAAREKAWAAFSADPEWLKVRRESIERGGQLTPVQRVALYKATDYSPIR